MRVTRKEFLSSLAIGLAGTALRPGRLLAASPSSDVISLESFQLNIGSSFRVIRPSGDPVAVVLQEVTSGPVSRGTAQFSLSFVAPEGENLVDKIYSFEHPKMGTLPIFITKVRTDPQGQTWYRADYNLLQGEVQPTQNKRKTVTVPARPPS